MSKDPSVQAFGLHGAVVGSRLDLLIIDDVVDFENARTAEQRDKLVGWVLSSLMGRLTAAGRVLVVGTAFHPEDLLHRLAGQGWPSYRFPVADDQGEPRWPQRWTRQRIADKRLELGPAEAARQLDVMARSDADSRFKQAWLDTALQRGTGKTVLPYLLNTPAGARVVHGWTSPCRRRPPPTCRPSSSCSCTPTATGSSSQSRAAAGRGRRSCSASRRRTAFGGTFVVESVAAQAYVSHFLCELGSVPVTDFKTGRKKMSLQWQCEMLAAELERGQWIVPSDGAGKPNNAEVGAPPRLALLHAQRAHP